jgi:hypothetical protein
MNRTLYWPAKKMAHTIQAEHRDAALEPITISKTVQESLIHSHANQYEESHDFLEWSPSLSTSENAWGVQLVSLLEQRVTPVPTAPRN